MKLTINTIKFQEMLSKAVKGASCDTSLAKTGLLSLKLKDNVLSMTTTNMNNYLVVKESGIEAEDFNVVVEISTFSKLISKITSDTITLELFDSYLNVVGNGNYKIELVLDENGKVINYSNPCDDFPKNEVISKITCGTIKKILNGVKPSLTMAGKDDSSSVNCYFRYHVSDLVVASNGYTVSALDTKVFNSPKLITADLMNLLGVVTDAELNIYENNKINAAGNVVHELLFESEHYSIYGVEVDGVHEFDIDSIHNWLSQSFPSYCKLPKNAIVQLLDRISLFVGNLDNDAISLTFNNDGLMVSSKASTGTEFIKYIESTNAQEFTCLVSIKLLAPQVNAQSGDFINLWYGDDDAIKLVDDDISSIIGLGV